MNDLLKEALNVYLNDNQVVVQKADDDILITRRGVKITFHEMYTALKKLGLEIEKPDLREALYNIATDPPTLEDDEEDNVQEDNHRSVLEIVNEAMTSLDCFYRKGDYYSSDGFKWPLDAVVFQIREYIRINTSGANVWKTDVLDALDARNVYLRKQDIAQKKVTLKFDPITTFPWTEFLTTLCGNDYDPMYEVVFRAKLWSIKRSIYGKPRWNPFLLNFYGKENTGKGVLTKAVFSNVLGNNLIGEITNMSDTVNDSRFGKMFTDNILTIIPELAGVEDTNITMLKSMIDREYIDIRVMGTTRFEKCAVHADIVTSSNEFLRDLFLADHSVRKWAEICIKYRHDIDEVMNEITLPFLGDEERGVPPKFDFLNMWRTVDEDGESPLRGVYTEFQNWTTRKCLYMSKANIFVRDCWLKLKASGVTQIDGQKIYESYVSTTGHEAPMAQRKFYERLELFGFTWDRRYTHHKKTFNVPENIHNMEI